TAWPRSGSFATRGGYRPAGEDRRPPPRPRSRGLELARQPEQRRFVAVPAGEQDADRDVIGRPVEGHGHRRLAGDVRDPVPRIERVVEALPGEGAAMGLVEDADRLRP